MELDTHHPVQDLHFRLTGPVVEQIQEVFTRDWSFTTGEVLSGDDWFPELSPTGECAARSVPAGPDDDFRESLHECRILALDESF